MSTGGGSGDEATKEEIKKEVWRPVHEVIIKIVEEQIMVNTGWINTILELYADGAKVPAEGAEKLATVLCEAAICAEHSRSKDEDSVDYEMLQLAITNLAIQKYEAGVAKKSTGEAGEKSEFVPGIAGRGGGSN